MACVSVEDCPKTIGEQIDEILENDSCYSEWLDYQDEFNSERERIME